MEFEGRSEPEAVQKASQALAIAEAELDYTVVDEGSTGLLGLGARPVQIRVRVPEAPAQATPAVQAAPVAQETPVEQVAQVAQESAAEANGAPGEEGEEDARGGMVGPAPEKAAKAREVAVELMARMGIQGTVEVRDEHTQIVVVLGEQEGSQQVGEVLGDSRPPAIPSLQFLLNKIVNRFPENRKHIVVEVPSAPKRERRERRYERRDERRDERRPEGEARRPERTERPAQAEVKLDPDLDPNMVALGRLLADRAKLTGRVITIHPMQAGDRRAIHQTVMTINGVRTVSEGEGLYRKMHVVPQEKRGGGGGGGGDADGDAKRRRRRRRRGRNEGEGRETQDRPQGGLPPSDA